MELVEGMACLCSASFDGAAQESWLPLQRDVKQAQWLKERLIMQYDPSTRWRRERAREWERVRVKTLEKANAVAWERYQNEKKTTEREGSAHAGQLWK